jgi:kynurenine 3-monooxygenase
MSRSPYDVTIVGGGLAGNLLAIFLARRQLRVRVIERRSRYVAGAESGGRSINLALAARGIEALRRCGAYETIEPLLLPMTGRMIHEIGQPERFAAYGQTSADSIYSVSRAALNYALYDLASQRHGVKYYFDTECTGVGGTSLRPWVEHLGRRRQLTDTAFFATDGAGSSVRRSLERFGKLTADEQLLDHGYKELHIPPSASGDFALSPTALHIWPRGEFMLIALPNTDRSFTATLFMPLEGDVSFASLEDADVDAFFMHEFPDALPLLGDLAAQFAANPTGVLGTVRCRPWQYAGRWLLLGDAAHAIVPFHGQGMNAAFEDVLVLDALIETCSGDWTEIFETFERERQDNADAIADMALENYREMRDTVRDPGFILRRSLALELERRFPGRFVPRYSMVMFHAEIPYVEAQRRGAAQTALLLRLTAEARSLDDVDFDLAARLVDELGRAPTR